MGLFLEILSDSLIRLLIKNLIVSLLFFVSFKSKIISSHLNSNYIKYICQINSKN